MTHRMPDRIPDRSTFARVAGFGALLFAISATPSRLRQGMAVDENLGPDVASPQHLSLRICTWRVNEAGTGQAVAARQNALLH